MPSGPPKWSSTMVVSGKARARSVSSAICGWNSQASKLRPSGASCAKPSRNVASSSRCSVGLLCELRICSLACQPAAWRMPRKRPRAAPMCASQHLAHRGAQAQVGEADDARGHARVAVAAAGAHRRDAVDELGLAHRAQRLGPVGAIHRRTFDEHRAAHVVARAVGIGLAGVGQQLVEQVAVAVAVPQVVVRVADRQLGLDDVFGAGHARSSAVGLSAAAQPRQREQRAQADADGVGAQVAPFARAVRHLQLQQLDRRRRRPAAPAARPAARRASCASRRPRTPPARRRPPRG